VDPDRIDLSPLDPARDPARWERFVQQTLHRAMPASVSPLLAALASRRGLLAVLAAAAMLTWIGAWTAPSPATGEEVDPALQLAEWAGRGTVPEAAAVSDLLGGARR